MILVDRSVGSFELQSLIKRRGVDCDKVGLEAADACFEGYGPDGMVLIGVERKKIQDALDCIESGRFGGFQLPKMRRMYAFRFVIIEGVWRPDEHGFLLEEKGKGWWTDRRHNGKREMYAKLRRYLFSVTMAGAHVLYTRDILHTAHDITELYHWFQKPWDSHTSMQHIYRGPGIPTEPVMISTVFGKPSVTRLWGMAIEGLGQKMSAEAERLFKTPRALANADESEWVTIPGIGMKMASDIVRQILGRKK